MSVPSLVKFSELAVDTDSTPKTGNDVTSDENSQEPAVDNEEFDPEEIFKKLAERIPSNWELTSIADSNDIKGLNSVTQAEFEGTRAYFNHLLGRNR